MLTLAYLSKIKLPKAGSPPCAFGSLHSALNAVKIKRHLTGLVFAGLALTFLINVFYVATSALNSSSFPSCWLFSEFSVLGYVKLISTRHRNRLRNFGVVYFTLSSWSCNKRSAGDPPLSGW